ncbi:MAG: rubrerythrin [Erysipelotrichaceae bacterium]
MQLKGSKTEANLKAAFAGEAQAHTKYQYYASQAKKEGYVQISEMFTQTAMNEKTHAKIWFKLLHNGVPSTPENLLDAASGENYEHTDMYAEFARVAREEGFDDIAAKFEGVGKIEAEHEARYQAFYENIKQNNVFEKADVVVWECLECGHLHVGTHAPEVCPICAHPKAYFEMQAKNY